MMASFVKPVLIYDGAEDGKVTDGTRNFFGCQIVVSE